MCITWNVLLVNSAITGTLTSSLFRIFLKFFLYTIYPLNNELSSLYIVLFFLLIFERKSDIQGTNTP